MIINSLILSNSMKQGNQLTGSLTGSFDMLDYDDNSGIESDILMAYDAGKILGYDQNNLIYEIEVGKLEGIPKLIEEARRRNFLD